jgi:hypothetical protein
VADVQQVEAAVRQRDGAARGLVASDSVEEFGFGEHHVLKLKEKS